MEEEEELLGSLTDIFKENTESIDYLHRLWTCQDYSFRYMHERALRPFLHKIADAVYDVTEMLQKPVDQFQADEKTRDILYVNVYAAVSDAVEFVYHLPLILKPCADDLEPHQSFRFLAPIYFHKLWRDSRAVFNNLFGHAANFDMQLKDSSE